MKKIRKNIRGDKSNIFQNLHRKLGASSLPAVIDMQKSTTDIPPSIPPIDPLPVIYTSACQVMQTNRSRMMEIPAKIIIIHHQFGEISVLSIYPISYVIRQIIIIFTKNMRSDRKRRHAVYPRMAAPKHMHSLSNDSEAPPIFKDSFICSELITKNQNIIPYITISF